MTRVAVGLAWVACLLASPRSALAHHLEQSRLELRPVSEGELRGRFLLAPRAFSAASSAGGDSLTTELRAQIDLRLDGARCTTPFILLELWTENSPSPGHLLDLRCPAPEGVTAPRVDIAWRGPSDLLVTYPPTETSAAISLLLAPDGRGSLLASEARSNAARATPVPTLAPNPSEPRGSKSSRALGLDLLGLAALCLSLAMLGRVLDQRRSRGGTGRTWLMRALLLAVAAAGVAIFVHFAYFTLQP